MTSASVQYSSVEGTGVAKTWEMSLSFPTTWSHGFSIHRPKVLKQICATNALFTQPRVNEEVRDSKNVFAVTRFHFLEVLFHSYCYWAKENCSLYQGLSYIEVPLYTWPPYPHSTYIILNSCTLSLRWVSILMHLLVGGGVGGRINQHNHSYSDEYLPS